MAGTFVERAPVMLVPETGRTPLATLDAGTHVLVLGEKDGWYQISFQDSYLLGDRIGYVQVRHLRVASGPRQTPATRAAGSASPDGAPVSRAADGAVNPRAGSARRLSDDVVAAAVMEGTRQKGVRQGLVFTETGELPGSPTTNGNGHKPSSDPRFVMQVHTPVAWIRQLAGDAALEGRVFTANDVTTEMTEAVLRVSAYSVVPAGSDAGTSWVGHVMLRSSASKHVFVHPLNKQAFAEHVVSATGGRGSAQGLRLAFSMGAVRDLMGPKGDAEFFITVMGANGEEKSFRVTKVLLAEIGM